MEIEKVLVLKMLYQGRPTIPEMAETIHRSYATVHKILQDFVAHGLVTPPRKKNAARDYNITPAGYQYLVVNGYVKESVNEGDVSQHQSP